MPVRKKVWLLCNGCKLSAHLCTDAQRALILLEEYRAKLSSSEDRQLRNSIQRVIDIFQSNLFQALIGAQQAKVYGSAPS
ncbi:hypothetical protein DNTS_018957 [Danionella cerebrum]|nr:hypothetical protein DNTS_018957 [Danionella translucida]